MRVSGSLVLPVFVVVHAFDDGDREATPLMNEEMKEFYADSFTTGWTR